MYRASSSKGKPQRLTKTTERSFQTGELVRIKSSAPQSTEVAEPSRKLLLCRGQTSNRIVSSPDAFKFCTSFHVNGKRR